MYIKKYKFFLASNYKKEEEWLNKMASQGLLFKKYSFFVYYFETGEKDSYTYRIDFIDKTPDKQKSLDYINLLEQTGIECVDSFIFWLYLRKKGKDFQLFSDVDSKIRNLTKILHFLVAVGMLLIATAVINLVIGAQRFEMSIVNTICGSFLSFLAVFFIFNTIKIARELNMLKKENVLRE